MLDRHLSKTGWFDAPTKPPWTLRSKDAPPIALFYSFKGGAGRSTALAAAALHLAAAGERVAVLDADLDAPGVGALLAGYDGAVASCGITDYLLEQRILANPAGIGTDDYHHRYAAEGGGGAGEIIVYPAGRFDRRYLGEARPNRLRRVTGRRVASLRCASAEDPSGSCAKLDSDRCPRRTGRCIRVPDRWSMSLSCTAGHTRGSQLARAGADSGTTRWRPGAGRQAPG